MSQEPIIKKLLEHDKKFEQIDKRFEQVDKRFDDVMMAIDGAMVILQRIDQERVFNIAAHRRIQEQLDHHENEINKIKKVVRIN